MRFDRHAYERLRRAYIERPGDHEYASRRSGVAYVRAVRTWNEGYPEATWGEPLCHAVEAGREAALVSLGELPETSASADALVAFGHVDARVGEVLALGLKLGDLQRRVGTYAIAQVEHQLERNEITAEQATALVRELSRAMRETIELAQRARALSGKL